MGKYDFIVWVVLLGIVGLFTLIRKFIEKATAGEQGKKIDLAKAVQAQLGKYMKAIEGSSSMFPGTGTPSTPPAAPVAEAPPARARVPARPALSPAKPAPPPAPVERSEATVRRMIQRKPLISTEARPLSQRSSAPVRIRDLRMHLTVEEVRKAIVLAEVLGPPIAERDDYRLF